MLLLLLALVKSIIV